MDPPEEHEDWLLVGVVGAPFGVHGEVKVDLATEFPDRFRLLQVIYTGPQHQALPLASARRHGGGVVLRFTEITDRTAAEALRGRELWIPQSQAIPLPAGRYYQHQILGLAVVTTAGEHLGRVAEILQTGSNDVYVVRDDRREVLIPAIHDVVQGIDLTAGVITVEAIEGLL